MHERGEKQKRVNELKNFKKAFFSLLKLIVIPTVKFGISQIMRIGKDLMQFKLNIRFTFQIQNTKVINCRRNDTAFIVRL